MNVPYEAKGEQGPGYEIYSRGLYIPPVPDEKVLMCEWKSSREKRVTEAALTCVVVAAVNSETRTGLLGHFGTLRATFDEPESDREIFDAAIEEIPRLGPPESTRIRLAGATVDLPGAGGPKTKQEIAQINESREYAETTVDVMARESGIYAVSVGWAPGYTSTDATVDPVCDRIIIWEEPA